MDRRSPEEKRLFKLATRPLYDLLPRNLKIQNLSHIKLTECQSKVLGIGFKFRPSLRPPTEAQFELEIKDFCHRFCLQDLFAHQPQDPDLNPQLYVPYGRETY